MRTEEHRGRREWQRLNAAFRRDRKATTLELATDFVGKYPATGPAYRIRGLALSNLCRFNEARLALQAAVALADDANRYIPLADLGDLFHRMGDHPTAVLWFRKAIGANPDRVGPRCSLSNTLAVAGDLRGAEDVLRGALGLPAGRQAHVHSRLAIVLRALNRFDESFAECRKALEIDPEDPDALKVLRDLSRRASYLKRAERRREVAHAG